MKRLKDSKRPKTDGGVRIAVAVTGGARPNGAQPLSKGSASPPKRASSQAKLKVSAPGPSSVWSKNPFSRRVGPVNAFARTAAGATQVPAFSASMPVPRAPTDVIASRSCEATHRAFQGPPLDFPLPVESEAIQAAASHPLVELVAEVKALRQTLDLIAKVLSSTR